MNTKLKAALQQRLSQLEQSIIKSGRRLANLRSDSLQIQGLKSIENFLEDYIISLETQKSALEYVLDFHQYLDSKDEDDLLIFSK
ncbi:hypothetical protein [Xanthocytophaga flava]|uniref:hypothetical protein n=1 Tax=Xanthocytophaga flava TaxID=3048013 RepID=UPI0028D881D3|nr:hypothetical protein [Xanthocytophaga flavus]MDJ1470184.1 hypothetical protein [Xanthocytophaga flavus]